MSDDHAIAGPVQDDPLAALAAQYPDWTIGPAPFGGVHAEHTSASGRHIRYIAARSVQELAGKLETAEVAGP